MRCDVAAVRIVCAVAFGFAAAPLQAQKALSSPASRASESAAYKALIDGMVCRQQAGGRMDCEFHVGSALRFVIAGVGQEDVAVSFVQADSTGGYVASMVPLHGCVAVKPANTLDATRAAGILPGDSVATFAFVSPRTGKVYRAWSACLSATRGDAARSDKETEARQDSIMRVIAERVVARMDSVRRADSVRAARRAKSP